MKKISYGVFIFFVFILATLYFLLYCTLNKHPTLFFFHIPKLIQFVYDLYNHWNLTYVCQTLIALGAQCYHFAVPWS